MFYFVEYIFFSELKSFFYAHLLNDTWLHAFNYFFSVVELEL